MKYRHLIQSIQRTPLAILPEKWFEIRAFLEAKADGVMFTEAEIAAATGGKRSHPEETQMFGSVAVIPVVGVLSHKMNMMGDISSPGGTSTQLLTQQLRATLADPAVTSIALSIDSPGGAVFGIPELADEIRAARSQKPVTAVVDPMAASAALWLASQAGDVVIAPSGTAGSIGVFMAHDDISAMQAQAGVKTTLISAGKFKTEGNMFEPLTADAIVHFQSQVDDLHEQFIKAVAAGRGVTQKHVRENMGQGRMLLAADAVKAGMADRIGTLEQTLKQMNAQGARGAKAGLLNGKYIKLSGEVLTTIREFEAFLRDAGWSNREAKALASGGFPALKGTRDVEPDEEQVNSTEAEAVTAWLEHQRLLREIRKSWN